MASLITQALTTPPELMLTKLHCPWPEHRGSAHCCDAISHVLLWALHRYQAPQSLEVVQPFTIDPDDATMDKAKAFWERHGVLAGPEVPT